MRGKFYCDSFDHKGDRNIDAKCPQGHDLPIIGITVDLIIEHKEKLWLVKRKEDGWALPGGFINYDETLEEAAKREAKEELGGKISILSQFHTYGDPERDHQRRNISVVYIAKIDKIKPSNQNLEKEGIEEVKGFRPEELPQLAFDHSEILQDYFGFKRRLSPLRIRRS
jgi:8-oxo-dGTP diphosphatase